MNDPFTLRPRFFRAAIAFGDSFIEQLRQYGDFPVPVMTALQLSQRCTTCGLPVGLPPCLILWQLVQRVRPLLNSYLKSGKLDHSLMWWACNRLVAPQC